MLGTVDGARGKPREVVKRLMVRLEIDSPWLGRVDHTPLDVRRLHPIGECLVPRTCIPGPRDTLGRERVTDRLGHLWRQRTACRVGETLVTTRGGWRTRRLVRWLLRVNRVAVGC